MDFKSIEVPGFMGVTVKGDEKKYSVMNQWFYDKDLCNGKPEGEKIIWTYEGVIKAKNLQEILNGEIVILGVTLVLYILFKAFSRGN